MRRRDLESYKLLKFKMAATELDADTVEHYKMDGKLVSQLKVDELKMELEKRSLKKSGVKKELQERLIDVRKSYK